MWFLARKEITRIPTRFALFAGLVGLVAFLVFVMTGLSTGLGEANVSGLRALTVDALVHEHSPAMYRLALSIVRDHSLAEDVVQEAMMKAWQALDNFRGDSSARTWLLRITHNTAISALRKRRDDITPPENLPERPSPHASVEERAVLQADALLLAALRLGRRPGEGACVGDDRHAGGE